MNQLFDRMIRAAKLDVNLYEEVEADKSATRQALVVVLIYSICAGIGSGLAMIWDESAGRFFLNLFVGLISALVFWLVWSLITYFIGTRLFKGPETQSNYGELLRTIGFAATPGIFMIFAFIPYIGGLIFFIVWVWMLIAMVIAVRQALDFTTGRAIGTVLVGGIIYIAVRLIIGIFWLDIYGVSAVS